MCPSGLRAAMVVVLACALTPTSAQADVVTLKNHAEYKGSIVREDTESVTILSDGAEWTFQRSQIADLKRDKATADENRAETQKRKEADIQAERSTVTVYGTSWCPVCRRAREYLQGRHVPFADKDVDHDDLARSEMRRKCRAAGMRYRGVPVIDAFGTLMDGFNEGRLAPVLHRHGY